jgi:hypothetical protein
MGYRLSWFAVRQVPIEKIHAELHLYSLGKANEADSSGNPVQVIASQLPNDWYVIQANHQREYWLANQILEKLSLLGHVVACDVCETTMQSAASGWGHGKLIWSVIHDAQVDGNHLEAYGELPVIYTGIREGFMAQQALENSVPATYDEFRVDYLFDVPIDLAASLTGFRHDLVGDDLFEALAFSSDRLQGISDHAPEASWLTYPSAARFKRNPLSRVFP